MSLGQVQVKGTVTELNKLGKHQFITGKLSEEVKTVIQPLIGNINKCKALLF